MNPEGGGKTYADIPSVFIESVMPIAQDADAKNVLKIMKHNPGAFFGTDLDVQLRRRKVDTILLTGVATTNGVYATALDAYNTVTKSSS